MSFTKNPAAWRADGVRNAVVAAISTPHSIVQIAIRFNQNFAALLASIDPAALVALAVLWVGRAHE
jgi:hypothetical protein